MATQNQIAKHLDMTDRNVREVLNKLGLSSKKNTLDEIRVAYLRHLRDQAAGRGGEDQGKLTLARTREAEASAHLKELQIMEKARQLVPVDLVRPGIEAMITAARAELLTLTDKVVIAIKTTHGIDIDPSLIQDFVYDSLQHLANTVPDNGADDVAAGDEGVGTAA